MGDTIKEKTRLITEIKYFKEKVEQYESKIHKAEQELKRLE